MPLSRRVAFMTISRPADAGGDLACRRRADVARVARAANGSRAEHRVRAAMHGRLRLRQIGQMPAQLRLKPCRDAVALARRKAAQHETVDRNGDAVAFDAAHDQPRVSVSLNGRSNFALSTWAAASM